MFSWQGQRFYLSIGLPDTPINRKAAEAKARQIELDFVANNFDSSLEKYKPQSVLTTQQPDITPKLKTVWGQGD